jgi:hypothetical protein
MRNSTTSIPSDSHGDRTDAHQAATVIGVRTTASKPTGDVSSPASTGRTVNTPHQTAAAISANTADATSRCGVRKSGASAARQCSNWPRRWFTSMATAATKRPRQRGASVRSRKNHVDTDEFGSERSSPQARQTATTTPARTWNAGRRT